MKKLFYYITLFALTGFGLLTVFLTISIFFDLFGIREMEGNYVLFVVWANFIAGIIYLVSAYGLLKHRRWAARLLFIAALILLASFIGLLIHISSGGVYETKTIYALGSRTFITLLFTITSWLLLNKFKNTIQTNHEPLY